MGLRGSERSELGGGQFADRSSGGGAGEGSVAGMRSPNTLPLFKRKTTSGLMEGAARTDAEAYGETCTCPPLPLAAPQEPPRVSGLLGGSTDGGKREV